MARILGRGQTEALVSIKRGRAIAYRCLLSLTRRISVSIRISRADLRPLMCECLFLGVGIEYVYIGLSVGAVVYCRNGRSPGRDALNVHGGIHAVEQPTTG